MNAIVINKSTEHKNKYLQNSIYNSMLSEIIENPSTKKSNQIRDAKTSLEKKIKNIEANLN